MAQVSVSSPELAKCLSPPFTSPLRVPISVASASARVSARGVLTFTYLSDERATPHSGAGGGPHTELLHRLLSSLERAQSSASAAAAAATAATEQASCAERGATDPTWGHGDAWGHGDLGISAFAAMDEHGYSLAE